ncbi:hypothetical protein ACX3PU_00435 [Chryseobacterium sp. A301]
MDKSAYKIEEGFKITSPTGVVYEFFAKENTKNRITNAGMHGEVRINTTAWYLTRIIDSNLNEVVIEYEDKTYLSTLSQSQSLAYTPGGVPQTKWGTPQSSTGTFCLETCSPTPYLVLPAIGLISQLEQTVYGGKQIKKISDTHQNSLVFSYTPKSNDVDLISSIKKYSATHLIEEINLTYETTPNARVFLSGLVSGLDCAMDKIETIRALKSKIVLMY